MNSDEKRSDEEKLGKGKIIFKLLGKLLQSLVSAIQSTIGGYLQPFKAIFYNNWPFFIGTGAVVAWWNRSWIEKRIFYSK